MRSIIIALIILMVNPVIFAQQNETKKKNELVEFKGFGEWEIWCIDIEQSGNIECNLNQVLVYKDHPDFRALIIRLYSDGKKSSRFSLNSEWQTSLSNGYIQIDEQSPLSLADCEKPCELQGEKLASLTVQFSSGEAAVIRIHDYLVQEFIIDIDLDQFDVAVESLHIMTQKYQ